MTYGGVDVGGENRPLKEGNSPRNRPRIVKEASIINKRPVMAKYESQAVLSTLFKKEDNAATNKANNTTVVVAAKPIQFTSPLPPNHNQSTTTTPHYSIVYTLLNPRSNQWKAALFKRFISLVIVCDLIIFIISTEPSISPNDVPMFTIAEGITSTIFLVEYIARLVTITERHKYKKHGPIMGRIRYACSIHALIDAFATFPFFVELLTGFDLPTLTYLRVFRLLRIAKTSVYSQATESVVRVIYYNREILFVSLILCSFLIVFTAVLMYYLRPPQSYLVESEDRQFKSIFACMYLSTLMLTGQGGPENGDNLPWYTKAVVLLTGVFSVAMFAIPASMFTWGFEAEAARMAKETYERNLSGGERNVLDGEEVENSSSSSSCSNSSSSDGGGGGGGGWWDNDDASMRSEDEAYLRLIAGEEESDGDDHGGGGDGSSNNKTTPSLEEAMTLIKRLSDYLDENSAGLSTKEDSSTGDNNATASSVSALSLMQTRIDRVEAKLDDTNSKLDQLIQIMQNFQNK